MTARRGSTWRRRSGVRPRRRWTDLADGIVVREDAGWVRVVTDGRALLRCTGVTDLQAGPFALVAALDALLAW